MSDRVKFPQPLYPLLVEVCYIKKVFADANLLMVEEI